MRLVFRLLLLVLVCAVTGLAGATFIPTLSERGAILGACLSLGIVFIDLFDRKKLDSSQQPGMKLVLSAAVLSGLLAGIALNLSDFMLHPEDQGYGGFVTPHGFGTAATALAYGLLMHPAYALRWRFQGLKSKESIVVFLVACVGVLAGVVRTLFMGENGFRAEMFSSGLMLGVLTGGPFAMLWALAMTACDPAWTFERWKKYAKV